MAFELAQIYRHITTITETKSTCHVLVLLAIQYMLEWYQPSVGFTLAGSKVKCVVKRPKWERVCG